MVPVTGVHVILSSLFSTTKVVGEKPVEFVERAISVTTFVARKS